MGEEIITYSQGLIRSISVSEKSAVLRVARVKPWVSAVAAMMRSSIASIRPGPLSPDALSTGLGDYKSPSR